MQRSWCVAFFLVVVTACSSGAAPPVETTPLDRGIRVTYSVDLDKAVDDKARELAHDLRAYLDDVKLGAEVRPVAVPLGAVDIWLQDVARRPELAGHVTTAYRDVALERPCTTAATLCLQIAPGHADAIRKAALGMTVATVRDRLHAGGVKAHVAERGDRLVVELPPLDDQRMADTRQLIARSARLELQLVDDGSPVMRQIYQLATADPAAQVRGITAEIEQWTEEESGARRTDYYLAAKDREELVPVAEAKRIGCYAPGSDPDGPRVRCRVSGRRVLEDYLADLARRDDSVASPGDRRFGYELMSESGAAPWWRTYLLHRAVALGGTSVSDATSAYDPVTGQPLVLIDFNRLGARALDQVTTQNVGRKLAISLDDRIQVAPIINAPIRGGRVSITMGTGEAAQRERDAAELVIALQHGALPAPLVEESVEPIGGGGPAPR